MERLDDRVLSSAGSREELDADARLLGSEPMPARKEDRKAHLGEGAFTEGRGKMKNVARLRVAGADRHDLGAVDEGEVVEPLRERYIEPDVQFVDPPSLRLGTPQTNLANVIVV
ncbi:MAG: hypothetical protein HYV07_07025 [Deltaproteobacteria bacterium]|nr:hypothetical protein [Deltaproteobacteria bacterium]